MLCILAAFPPNYAQQAINWNTMNLAGIQQAVNAIQQQQAQQHQATLQQLTAEALLEGYKASAAGDASTSESYMPTAVCGSCCSLAGSNKVNVDMI